MEDHDDDSDCWGTPGRRLILLLGDSITQYSFEHPHGWALPFMADYACSADVINRGFSGYNTSMWLDVWSLALRGVRQPSLVTVWLGANDAALDNQHCPLPLYTHQLEQVVQRLRAHWATAPQVLLITPPPVYEPKWLLHCQQAYGSDEVNRTNETTGSYARACVTTGQRLQVPVVDMWTSFQQLPNWDSLLSDGLHLSAEGNNAAYMLIRDAIAEHFPELAASKLSGAYVPWKQQLQHTNATQSQQQQQQPHNNGGADDGDE